MTANPYIDDFGYHAGYCNNCDTEQELGQDCQDCDEGEAVPYLDDPDADQW